MSEETPVLQCGLRRLVSPGNALMALGIGHAGWGTIAYGRQLRDLVGAGANSVGDGIFRTDHAKDDRAAAFWFIAAAPLVIQSGYLVERALRVGDGETVAHVGWVWAAFGAAGVAVMPSGGFVGLLPIGAWMAYRGSRIGRGPHQDNRLPRTDSAPP